MASTDQPEPKLDQLSLAISTAEGRETLFNEWLNQRISEGSIDPQKSYTPQERSALLKLWLQALIAQGKLDPHKRLPPYASLGELPFSLSKHEVALVIADLRGEGLLPRRNPRMDKDKSQWTERDDDCIRWIGEMRAIRFDQLQCLLARLSKYETADPSRLSVSRTSQVVARWARAGYAVYRRVYAQQPGWVYLTRKGLYHANLPYRAEPPRDRLLEHIRWINATRLKLEEGDPSLQWISERTLQAAQQKRQKGQRLEHTPDGVIVSGLERIDVEVQVSRPAQQRVEQVMRGSHGRRSNPLRYYAGASAIAVVRRAYRAVTQGGWHGRPRIEIVALEEFLEPAEEGESA